jgi:hypothetical protein
MGLVARDRSARLGCAGHAAGAAVALLVWGGSASAQVPFTLSHGDFGFIIGVRGGRIADTERGKPRVTEVELPIVGLTPNKWIGGFTLVEDSEPDRHDRLRFLGGFARHLIAPHEGEDVPGELFEFTFGLTADFQPVLPYELRGPTSKPHDGMDHPLNHKDRFGAVLAWQQRPNDEGKNDFTSYILLVAGWHPPTDQRTAYGVPFNTSPNVTSSSLGAALATVGMETGLFDLAVAATGIAPADVTSASIRLGRGGPNDPAVLQIGLESLRADEAGLSLVLTDAEINPAFLLEGSYVELLTNDPAKDLRLSLVIPPSGDLDDDGDVDAADIDLLSEQVRLGSIDPRFDLDGSGGPADRNDAGRLVLQILGTKFGDADLDGGVNVLGDGSVLVANLGNEGGWARGDFDGDGLVSVLGDGQLLVANLGFGAPAALAGGATAVVPEPSLILPAAAGLVLLQRRGRWAAVRTRRSPSERGALR